MINWLDRNLQLDILKYLQPLYPNEVSSKNIAAKLFPEHSFTFEPHVNEGMADAMGIELKPEDDKYTQIQKNIHYLYDSCLINLKIQKTMSFIKYECSINNRGIDFLEDDGGLSSILGVVTIKLHADTIKALIQQKIEAADITDSEKSALKSTVSKIGDAALATLTEKAIEAVPIMYFFSVLKSLGNG